MLIAEHGPAAADALVAEAGPHARRTVAAAEERIAADFRAGRTISVSRLLLSRTEAAIYVTAARA